MRVRGGRGGSTRATSLALLALVSGVVAGCGEPVAVDLADDTTPEVVDDQTGDGTPAGTDTGMTGAEDGDATETATSTAAVDHGGDPTAHDEPEDDPTARDEPVGDPTGGEDPDDGSTVSRDDSDAHAAMSFADFHPRRQELVGQSVSVEGRVLFDLTCPPPDQPDQDCIAEAQLVDPSVQDLSETDDVVPLFEGDKTIACTAQTTNDLECRGLRDGETYVVDARVDERTGYGVVLDVRSFRSTG